MDGDILLVWKTTHLPEPEEASVALQPRPQGHVPEISLDFLTAHL